MRPSEKIENAVKKMNFTAGAELREQILNDALKAHEQTVTQPAFEKPNIWRIIMKSKITKLSAAAAVIIIIGVIGVQFLTGTSAYAQVVQEIRNARTVVYTLITQTNQGNGETVKTDVAYKEPGLLRMSTVDGYVIILDSTSGKVISIVPTLQMYTIGDVKNLLNNIDTKGPFDSIESMKSLPAKADEHLDPKEIDGIVCRGYRVKQGDLTTTVWIDVKTGDLVQVEQKYASAPGMNKIIKNIKFDVVLDDSLFSLTPPEGYRPSELKSNAFASAATEDMFIEFLRLWSSLTVDGTFPPLATPTPKVIMDMGQQGKLKGEWNMAAMIRMTNGMLFVYRLPQSSNWRYIGNGVKINTPDTPIFWYRLAGSKNYRVIYADLTVHEVTEDQLPK